MREQVEFRMNMEPANDNIKTEMPESDPEIGRRSVSVQCAGTTQGDLVRLSDLYACDQCEAMFVQFKSFKAHAALHRLCTGIIASSSLARPEDPTVMQLIGSLSNLDDSTPADSASVVNPGCTVSYDCVPSVKTEAELLETRDISAGHGVKTLDRPIVEIQTDTQKADDVVEKSETEVLRRYSCGWCSRSFTLSSHVAVHERIHTGDMPYACVQCGRRFNVLSNLRVHMKRKVCMKKAKSHRSVKSAKNSVSVACRRSADGADEVEGICAKYGKSKGAIGSLEVEMEVNPGASKISNLCDLVDSGIDAVSRRQSTRVSRLCITRIEEDRESQRKTDFVENDFKNRRIRSHPDEHSVPRTTETISNIRRHLRRGHENVALSIESPAPENSTHNNGGHLKRKLFKHRKNNHLERTRSCKLSEKKCEDLRPLTRQKRSRSDAKSNAGKYSSPDVALGSTDCVEMRDITAKNVKAVECSNGGMERDSRGVVRNTESNECEVSSRRYTCSYCPRSFSMSGHIKVHERIHTGARPYACTMCGRRFNVRSNLRKHVKGKSCLRQRKGCSAAMMSGTPDVSAACESSAEQVNTTEHIVSDAEIPGRQLKGRNSKDKKQGVKSLQDSSTRGYGEKKNSSHAKPYVCCFCPRSYARPQSILLHYGRHFTEDKETLTPRSEELKKREIVLKKEYVCCVCDQRCASKSYLTTHLLSHTGDKPYTCDVCGNGFKQIAHLRQHLRTHERKADGSAQRKFLCSICGASYFRRYALNRHLGYHALNLRCEVCGTAAATKRDLARHMNVFHEAKKYTCLICNHGYDTRTMLALHVQRHENPRPFPCTLCSRKYAFAIDLRKHVKAHHPSADVAQVTGQTDGRRKTLDGSSSARISSLFSQSNGETVSDTSGWSVCSGVAGQCNSDSVKETCQGTLVLQLKKNLATPRKNYKELTKRLLHDEVDL